MTDLPAIIREIRDQLADQFHPQRILLFGSWAKGTQAPRSDIDVLVVTTLAVPPDRQALARALFYDYPTKVDVLFCTTEYLRTEGRRSHSFLHAISKQPVTLYEVHCQERESVP